MNNIAQRAALAALTGPQDEAEEFRVAFDRRRKLIVERAREDRRRHRAEPARAPSTSTPTCRACSAATWRGKTPTTSLELADLILEEAEVAVVPGEAFGPSGYLRLSYALGDEALLEGVRRMQELFAS